MEDLKLTLAELEGDSDTITNRLFDEIAFQNDIFE